jgi:S-adenosylmethionine:tRNA ribosyltransferase-isomerase
MFEGGRFEYSLPGRLIAQQPLANRFDARLMVVSRGSGDLAHRHVRDLPELLRSSDVLVINNTRVVPARLVGRRLSTGGRWEGLFLSATPHGDWRLLCKTRGKLKPPEPIQLVGSDSGEILKLWLLERTDEGVWIGRPEIEELPHLILERIGRVPLPPYIRSGEMVQADRLNYQTVYAKVPGAVAAPTAGLHFTPQLLQRMQDRNIERREVTLHIGLDTFRPITAERLDQHKMHSEWGEISDETAVELRERRAAGGRIVAVGTTSVRVLETAARDGKIRGWSGNTDLFIRPPYAFRAVDALMTNFHLPRTTLLLLVTAFGGEDLIRRAYEEAVREEYRFYSYGDAMLIL